MLRPFHRFSFLISSASFLILGCALHLDFDEVLNSAIGAKIENLRYPSLEYLDKDSPSDGLSRNYKIVGCKWKFHLAQDNSTIVGWNYLDVKSAEQCHNMVRWRP